MENRLYFGQAYGVWAKKGVGEDNAPDFRIIHNKILQFDRVIKPRKIGIKIVSGFFKCGSQFHPDWIKMLNIYYYDGARFVKTFTSNNIECALKNSDTSIPPESDFVWLEFECKATNAIIVEIRECNTDKFFVNYNVANWGFEVEYDECENFAAKAICDNRFTFNYTNSETVKNIFFKDLGNFVSYKTSYYEIEFYKNLPRIKQLFLKQEGEERFIAVLKEKSTYGNVGDYDFYSGFLLHTFEEGILSGGIECALSGEILATNKELKFKIFYKQSIFEITLLFNVNSIELHINQDIKNDIACIDFAFLRFSFNTEVSPPSLLGVVNKTGRVGNISFPAIMHFPTINNILLSGDGSIGFNSLRMKYCEILDVLGNAKSDKLGYYVLEKGKTEQNISMNFDSKSDIILSKKTPIEIKKAVYMYANSCVPFRADINSLSNNANSIQCYLCLDNFAYMVKSIGKINGKIDSDLFLQATLENWLNDVPAYASGYLSDKHHNLEEEYLMNIASALNGLSYFLSDGTKDKWSIKYKDKIADKLDFLFFMDKDSDGLIESDYRLGNSGEHQWSTCWYDIISFGYKDAYTNAILYEALNRLIPCLQRIKFDAYIARLSEMRDKIEQNYMKVFYNKKSDRIIGWKSGDGQIHDYGFLFVNGAAVNAGLVDDDIAKRIIGGLYNELAKSEVKNFYSGLTANIYEIPPSDMAKAEFTFGLYQNGSSSLSQSRHFLDAMIKVGLGEQAEEIFVKIAIGLTNRVSVGGVGSGVDWQTPQGVACGYEGILSDQFGVIASMINKYGEKQ